MYENGLWVFGYGSLIWKPGFEYVKKQRATLFGFQRAFCLWSIHYRGTEAKPGLVLGLDPEDEAHCEGVAYHVGPEKAKGVHKYLRARELVSYAYFERMHPVRLADGQEVPALCYIVDPAHGQYAGGLGLKEQASTIATAAGSAGDNREYLFNTAKHLAELGIEDSEMQRLVDMVRRASV